MKVPQYLYKDFNENFEKNIFSFLSHEKLLVDHELSERTLNRNIAPHIKNLSSLFNRKKTDQSIDAAYWKKTSNPNNLKLAYFLYFMPFNFFRSASILGELQQLGFKWESHFSKKELKIIEFGAGPASGLSGFLFALNSLFPKAFSSFDCALIDHNKAIGELGEKWLNSFSEQNNLAISSRFFHRKIELNRPLLPPKSPKFDIWIMSFFLNEYPEPLHNFTPHFLKSIDTHLEEEGLVIIIEPALKEESRKLLEWRKNLIHSMKNSNIKILLPCLGEQACGALEKPGDWCHEDILFLRPKYIESLDRICNLNHRSLPFSYLILMKTKKSLKEIFPALSHPKLSTPTEQNSIYRLVSPSHKVGKDLEFFICGQKEKTKARLKPQKISADEKTKIRETGGKVENELNRGNIISAQLEVDSESEIKKILSYQHIK